MTGDRGQETEVMKARYKFHDLQIYQLALDYIDIVYDISKQLPAEEKYNLTSQIRRASTSIALNIAEGSTGQTDPEQYRFIGMALRSYLETIACLDIIERQRYLSSEEIEKIRNQGHDLFVKLIAFRKTLK